MILTDSGSSDATVSSTGITLNTSTWYQVAYTKTGGTGTLYVNGVSNNTVSDSITTISSSNGQLGRRWNSTYSGAQVAFDGYIGEAAMFDRALTSTEIASLWNGNSINP